MKNYNYLASELGKLGLNKKEAEIYLILLKIGYCSVQKIAEKVDLSRPTVYRTLEKLKKKNLINTTQKGKRNYFIAGSPDALLNILRIKKRQAEEQEREFLRIINILQNQYQFSSKENIIEIYDKSQKSLVLEKLANNQLAEIKFISNKFDPEIEEIFEKLRKKIGSKFKVKKLSLKKEDQIKKDFIKTKSLNKKSLFLEDNILITDKIFILNKNTFNIIKNKNTVKAFSSTFSLLWEK
jgi:sugar-specific transcriptional regulator TrmB